MKEDSSANTDDKDAKQLFLEIAQHATKMEELIASKLEEPKSINSRASFSV